MHVLRGFALGKTFPASRWNNDHTPNSATAYNSYWDEETLAGKQNINISQLEHFLNC